MYDGYPNPIQRADASRLVYMYLFGGVYADLDFECLDKCGDCEPEVREIFKALEAIVIPIFTVEYLISLLTVHDAECVDAETLIAAMRVELKAMRGLDLSATTHTPT